MPMFVKEIMSKPAYTIDESKTAKDAALDMSENRRGFLVVTKSGKPVGVLSDSDIISKVVSKNILPQKIKIKEIMSSPVVTTQPNDDVTLAVKKMKNNNIHRLPVTDKGKIVGVISLTDIARSSPDMVDLLEYRLKMKEEPFELKEKITSGVCEVCGNFSSDLKNIDGVWTCEDCMEES